MLKRLYVCAAGLPLALAIATSAAAQAVAQPAAPGAPLPPVTVCGQSYAPAAEPPAGSGPVLLTIAPCFAAQGGVSLVDIQTYLYYMQIVPKASKPSQGIWTPYDVSIEQMMHDDFRRLLATNFLDNLSIETTDYPFPNGTVGKIAVYNMEERQRVKIVDYVGSKKIETTKIDDKLK